MSDMEEYLRGRIAEQFGMAAAEITDDKNFFEDLGADSLDLVEIVVGAEERFKVTVSDESCERMETVGDLIQCLTQAAGEVTPGGGSEPRGRAGSRVSPQSRVMRVLGLD